MAMMTIVSGRENSPLQTGYMPSSDVPKCAITIHCSLLCTVPHLFSVMFSLPVKVGCRTLCIPTPTLISLACQ